MSRTNSRVSTSVPTLRVGIDVTSVADVRSSIEVFGDRYLDRLFTADELHDCRARTQEPQLDRLAARFAAKEAVMKVLRPVDDAPSWNEIEVRTTQGGWPEIELSGVAARMATDERLAGISVSLSHEHDVATAVVTAFQGV